MDPRTVRSMIGAAAEIMHNFMDPGDDSDSEEELVEAQVHLINEQEQQILPVRIENYIGNVVELCSDKQFQQNFRVSVPAFESLLQRLHRNLSSDFGNRPQVDPKKQLLAVLWLLATPDSYRSVGERFDMSKGTLFQAFTRVVKALNIIAHDVIRWPTETERVDIKAAFADFSGLNDVIGAIDGTYVNIKAPKENAQRYVNRKGTHGVTLQAVAIPSLKFTDCFAGYPSSVGDRRIFVNSDIYSKILTNTDQHFGNNEFIIGDKAYPVLKWCIPPYIDRGNLQDFQTYFNTVQAKTRQVIERSFALLFGRFRRLKYLDMNRVDLIPFTIVACCVLHNICLSYNDLNVQDYINEGMQQLENEEGSETNEEVLVNFGHRRRDEIAATLYSQRT